MEMYSRSSNALKDEYYTYELPKKNVSIKKEKRSSAKISSVHEEMRTKQAHRAKKLMLQSKLRKQKIVATVSLVSSMAFLLLFRYATIAKEFSTLTEAKNELAGISAQVVEKQMEAEGNVDPKRIEQEAERLGLSQPTKEQIKYISLGNKDNGEVLKSENKSAVSAFINRLAGILEYLY